MDADRIDTVLCDLDGVIWLDRTPIPRSVDAVAALRRAGRRVVFVTNNSTARVEVQERALAAIGIPAVGDVVTSAMAAASLVGATDRVMVCGEEGVAEAIRARGASIVDDDPEVVVVGLDRHFDYRTLHRASSAVRAGARYIATNDDAAFPTPAGLIPGAGAIVAAVTAASGREPELAGKPHRAMARAVATVVGPEFDPRHTVVVGDRWSTDGEFAGTIGCRFALVRSGVTAPGDAVAAGPRGAAPEVWLDAADLWAVIGHGALGGDDSVAAW